MSQQGAGLTRLVPIAVALVVTLSACTTGAHPTPDETPAVTTETPTSMVPDGYTPSPLPSGLRDEDTGEEVTPQAVPTWDEASRASAEAAAVVVMTAFARPQLDYDTWWADLGPLLTQQAAVDYAYVDPANVPASAVTGTATIVDDTSAYVARVEVPTDVGTYAVTLTRTDATAPWLTSRIAPPESEG